MVTVTIFLIVHNPTQRLERPVNGNHTVETGRRVIRATPSPELEEARVPYLCYHSTLHHPSLVISFPQSYLLHGVSLCGSRVSVRGRSRHTKFKEGCTGMTRRFLKAKLHKAHVTETELEYEGSLTIDRDLMDAAGILPNEAVDVYNITRGTRFTTYAIVGERGKGDLKVNGAAAHLAEVGDRIIVVTYCDLHSNEIEGHEPVVLVLDENNRPR
jgi:aspartate 1-decarboxylase